MKKTSKTVTKPVTELNPSDLRLASGGRRIIIPVEAPRPPKGK